MSDLLENAVTSIQLGLEDFSSEDERRVISAARNLYAGVLLLCKEVLRCLSPPDSNDVLIRTRRRPTKGADGTIRYVGEGKHTIDRPEIERIFSDLKIDVDLSKLKRLAEIRNDIEHMAPSVGPTLIQEAIADAMPIIRAIVVNELKEEPAELLGVDAWDTMLKRAEIFKREQEACRATFGSIDWGSDTLAHAAAKFSCPECGSTLMRNNNSEAKQFDDVDLACSKCGAPADAEYVFEEALERELRFDDYIARKEGLEAALDTCPECRRETFIVSEDRCANCAFSLEGRECSVCAQKLTLDDYRYGSGSLCGYHQYTVSKDD